MSLHELAARAAGHCSWWLAVALVVGCGGRTGLEAPETDELALRAPEIVLACFSVGGGGYDPFHVTADLEIRSAFGMPMYLEEARIVDARGRLVATFGVEPAWVTDLEPHATAHVTIRDAEPFVGHPPVRTECNLCRFAERPFTLELLVTSEDGTVVRTVRAEPIMPDCSA